MSKPKLKVVGEADCNSGGWKTASDERASEVHCLWEPYFVLGAPNLLSGPGSLGKSTLCADIAARGSRGDVAPDGKPFFDGKGVPFDTAILGAEDPYDRVLRPRLAAMGADLDRILLINNNPLPNIGERAGRVSYFDKLRAIKEQPGRNLRFAYIDGWKDFMHGVNTWDDNQIRPIMLDMNVRAGDLDLAELGIVHPNKNDPKGIGGSRAFFDNSRAVACVVASPTTEHPHRAVFIHKKHNWTYRGAALAYEPNKGAIRWLGPIDEGTLVDVSPDPDEVGRMDAKALLNDILTEQPRLCESIMKLARAYGIQGRTMRKARVDIGALSQRFGFGSGAYVMWFRDATSLAAWEAAGEEWRTIKVQEDRGH